ncbi:hypothetical protein [Streptomyces sp. NPDC017529]|uniref:hypothetical protein n=1 Tax=Streptomyces sp. NPDC017529 TaxID=3365000 RepID=UPI003791F37A
MGEFSKAFVRDSANPPALREVGQEPVARIECRGGRRLAWLYRIDLAKPKFPMTLAKEAALDKATAARQTCPGPCGRRYFHRQYAQTLGDLLGVLQRHARRPHHLHHSPGVLYAIGGARHPLPVDLCVLGAIGSVTYVYVRQLVLRPAAHAEDTHNHH